MTKKQEEWTLILEDDFGLNLFSHVDTWKFQQTYATKRLLHQ